MEGLLKRAWYLISILREGSFVHIFEKLIFLHELVFEDLELRIDLPILIRQAIDMNLRVHILLVQILTRLQGYLWDFALHLANDFFR